MTSPWPFAIWGIDLIGELPKSKGGVKYAVVAVDYFTNWAEAAPLATITTKKIKDFVFNSIVCRFGIPYKLISDNGKQFDSKELRGLCDDLGIKKDFAPVHPQSNGQTEAVNKIIKHTLKTKLEDSKENWPEELPMVVWSYNTTPKTTTGESPFVLAYGCEAMVTIEIGAVSFRRDYFDKLDNDANHRLYLDMIEEIRATSQIRLAACQQRTARYYNSKVKAHPFQVGDLACSQKSCAQLQEPLAWSFRCKLGRPLQGKSHTMERNLQIGRPKWKVCSAPLECGTFEEILSVAEGCID